MPWEFVKHVLVSPAPAVDGAHAGAFTNDEREGRSPVGVSASDGDGSWPHTVVWVDDVAQRPDAGAILGHDASGNIDVSPRVVHVCPGREWELPRESGGFFGPGTLDHAKIAHGPGW